MRNADFVPLVGLDFPAFTSFLRGKLLDHNLVTFKFLIAISDFGMQMSDWPANDDVIENFMTGFTGFRGFSYY